MKKSELKSLVAEKTSVIDYFDSECTRLQNVVDAKQKTILNLIAAEVSVVFECKKVVEQAKSVKCENDRLKARLKTACFAIITWFGIAAILFCYILMH